MTLLGTAIKSEMRRPGLTIRQKTLAERGFVFMRWKERFLVPEHKVRGIRGASYDGAWADPLNTWSIFLIPSPHNLISFHNYAISLYLNMYLRSHKRQVSTMSAFNSIRRPIRPLQYITTPSENLLHLRSPTLILILLIPTMPSLTLHIPHQHARGPHLPHLQPRHGLAVPCPPDPSNRPKSSRPCRLLPTLDHPNPNLSPAPKFIPKAPTMDRLRRQVHGLPAPGIVSVEVEGGADCLRLRGHQQLR